MRATTLTDTDHWIAVGVLLAALLAVLIFGLKGGERT